MIRSAISLAFLLSFFTLLAQPAINQMDAKGKKQGKWLRKDAKGILLYEGTFKDDKPTGEFKYYYDTGELKTVSVFSGAGTVSRTKHYFPGNILMAEGKYINQKRDSIWKFYNGPNSLVSEETYKNGKKDGTEKILDGKGNVVEVKLWKDSIPEGAWKKFYPNGDIQEEKIYKAGLIEGEVHFYFPEKKKAVTGNYLHSVKTGKWTYHNRDGLTNTMVENYKAGNLEGPFAEWYEKDGTPKVKGEYVKGRRNNKWTYYDDKGKLSADTTFHAGYLHGICVEYYGNGNKKTESNYYFSHPTGKWMEWDAAGEVVKEENFPSIEEIKKKNKTEPK
jgi:antitoxin component YwqK of YwqJK toxin-antitoxin module